MKALFIVLLTSTILAAHASSREEIALQFISFPRSASLEPIELLIGDGKTKEIYIPGHELSQVYRVNAMDFIAVGTTSTNEEGDPTFEVFGQARSIAARRQIILLLRKGEQNSDGFTVLPINGEVDQFAGGSFMFFNAANLPVGGIIGETQFALRPGQRRLITPAATHAGGGCQVTLSFQTGDTWRRFFDTRWTVNPRFRSMVFFFQDPQTGQLGVSPIVDVL